jgi:hypothetical protein
MSGSKPKAPPPAPSNMTQTTIPEYAKPYMERLLGKAEALTSARYQPYQGQRIAAATQGQLNARNEAANLESPGQFGVGTGMAGAAGFGSMGLGQQYMQMATNPYAQQAFMSPYMQNVVDVQKQQALRDAQIGQLTQNLGSARQGTFGGARQLLATTERERALQSQMGDIQAKGLQTAYDQALESMRYGIDTSMAGYGQGIQAAQLMGQLGESEQAATLNRLRAQEEFGQMSQLEQQRAMDMRYQDFLSQQQHPYAQLGFMSDLLRGSANLAQSGSGAVYQAPPSLGAQIMGTGIGALGALQAFGGK